MSDLQKAILALAIARDTFSFPLPKEGESNDVQTLRFTGWFTTVVKDTVFKILLDKQKQGTFAAAASAMNLIMAISADIKSSANVSSYIKDSLSNGGGLIAALSGKDHPKWKALGCILGCIGAGIGVVKTLESGGPREYNINAGGS